MDNKDRDKIIPELDYKPIYKRWHRLWVESEISSEELEILTNPETLIQTIRDNKTFTLTQISDEEKTHTLQLKKGLYKLGFLCSSVVASIACIGLAIGSSTGLLTQPSLSDTHSDYWQSSMLHQLELYRERDALKEKVLSLEQQLQVTKTILADHANNAPTSTHSQRIMERLVSALFSAGLMVEGMRFVPRGDMLLVYTANASVIAEQVELDGYTISVVAPAMLIVD